MITATILAALKVVPVAVAALPEFKKMFDDMVDTFDGQDDQETLKSAYDDLMADNDEGFARLDRKLAAAEQE